MPPKITSSSESARAVRKIFSKKEEGLFAKQIVHEKPLKKSTCVVVA
jgi:hypothetical protein